MAFQLGTFNFNNTSVRIVTSTEDRELLWFVASDVASILEYTESSAMVKQVAETDKTKSSSLDGLPVRSLPSATEQNVTITLQ